MSVEPCALCWHRNDGDHEQCKECRDIRDSGMACGPHFTLDKPELRKLRGRIRLEDDRADRECAAYHADQDKKAEEGGA